MLDNSIAFCIKLFPIGTEARVASTGALCVVESWHEPNKEEGQYFPQATVNIMGTRRHISYLNLAATQSAS